MLSLLAAAAVAATPAGDPDIRCMAAYLYAVGSLTEDPQASDEDKTSATTMVMYFFGKVRGRMPEADVKNLIKPMVNQPGYLSDELKSDLERCAVEYVQRGKELEAFGDE